MNYITVIGCVLGFLTVWMPYNFFISLQDAVGTSAFSYYVKKITLSLFIGAFFLGFMYAGIIQSWIS